HWPPHLANRFRDVASKGDRIRVIGRMETGPAGDTHFEVQTVTNGETRSRRPRRVPKLPPFVSAGCDSLEVTKPLAAEPCLGVDPILFGCRRGDAQDLGRLGDRAAEKKMQLHQLGLAR